MDFCAKTPGIHFVRSPLTKPYTPGLRIETGTPTRKQTFEIAAADHLLGRKAVERRRIDQRNGVAERKRNIQVMGREEDTFLLVAGQAPQQRRQFVAVRQVEEGRGFVEQDHRGVLGQRPGLGHGGFGGQKVQREAVILVLDAAALQKQDCRFPRIGQL